MPLEKMNAMLSETRKGRYTVGAFKSAQFDALKAGIIGNIKLFGSAGKA